MGLERRVSLHKGNPAPPLSAEITALRPGDREVLFKEVTLTPFPSQLWEQDPQQQQDLSASGLLCGEQLGPGLFSRSLQLVIPVYIPLTLGLCLCCIWQDVPIPPQCLHVLQVILYPIPSWVQSGLGPCWTPSHKAARSVDMANGSTCAVSPWVAL